MSFFITPHSFLKTVDSPRSFRICSPYVTEHGLGALIDVLRPFGRPVEILIGAKDSFNDPNVLRRLLNESLYMRWNAKWSPTDELHAKIYAVQQNNSDWRVLITSANLTKAFTGAGIEAGMVRIMSDDSFQSSWQDLLTRALSTDLGENEINSYENQRARSKESENILENLFFGIRSAELYFFRDSDPIYQDQILFDHDENPTTRFFLPKKLSPDGQSLIPLMGKNHALSEISWRYHTPTSELWYSYTVDRDNEEVNGFTVMRVVREFHASDDGRTLIPLLMECARLGYFDGNPNENRIRQWVSENRRRGMRPFFCRHDYSREAFTSLGINLANREIAEIDRSFRHYFENKKEIRQINVPTKMDKKAPISDFISIEDFKRLWSLSL